MPSVRWWRPSGGVATSIFGTDASMMVYNNVSSADSVNSSVFITNYGVSDAACSLCIRRNHRHDGLDGCGRQVAELLLERRGQLRQCAVIDRGRRRRFLLVLDRPASCGSALCLLVDLFSQLFSQMTPIFASRSQTAEAIETEEMYDLQHIGWYGCETRHCTYLCPHSPSH